MTLEAAVVALTSKMNEMFLKLCDVADDVTLVKAGVNSLATRIGLIEEWSRMGMAFGAISTAPFYIGNSLNSGFQPSFTLVTNLTGDYPGKAALLNRVSVEQNLIRGSYGQYMERLSDYYGAFCNELPSVESVIPFFAPDSASAWCVESLQQWIPEILVPVVGANTFYIDYLTRCYEWLTRFGYRDELDVEMIVPDLFDDDGDIVRVKDGGGVPIPENLSRLVPKRLGIVSNTGVSRASIPVTAAWIGYVESLLGYVEELP